MAKYIFVKDATIIPFSPSVNGSLGQAPPIIFKKGDIIEGIQKGNPKNDTGYLEAQTKKGLVHISTGRGTPIQLYAGTSIPIGKSPSGRYKFTSPHSINVCVKYKEQKSMPPEWAKIMQNAQNIVADKQFPPPVCEIYKQITFQIGDVVEVAAIRMMEGKNGW